MRDNTPNLDGRGSCNTCFKVSQHILSHPFVILCNEISHRHQDAVLSDERAKCKIEFYLNRESFLVASSKSSATPYMQREMKLI